MIHVLLHLTRCIFRVNVKKPQPAFIAQSDRQAPSRQTAGPIQLPNSTDTGGKADGA